MEKADVKNIHRWGNPYSTNRIEKICNICNIKGIHFETTIVKATTVRHFLTSTKTNERVMFFRNNKQKNKKTKKNNKK